MEFPKVVVIGGGTGVYTVLYGLKGYPLRISAIVSMADSGGSAKRERDEFGILPVSDVRKALIALSDLDGGDDSVLRELFNFRFPVGLGIEGTALGNLFLVALTSILGSEEKAIDMAGKILRCRGEVIPVTLEKTNLVAEYEEGLTVVGEHEIDEPKHDGRLRVNNLYLLPQVKSNPRATKSITEADVVVIGPGDLYTSLLPPLIVKGISEAILGSKSRKVFVLNLVNKYGQTYGFTASDYLKEIYKYTGIRFDYVLVNSSKLPEEVLLKYAEEKSFPIQDDLGNPEEPKIIRGDFVSRDIVYPQKGDKLKRSLLRHDPVKLSKVISDIAYKNI